MGISEADVRRDLGEHFHALHELVGKAVDTYNSYPASLKKAHSKRSRASLIHDHFLEHAAAYAERRQESVRLVETKHLWVFYFQTGYAMRFKKVDDEKMTAGQLTEQVRNFRSQADVVGIPISTHLDLGYQLTELGQLAHVYIVCPSGIQSNAWDVEITATDVKSVVVNLFPPPKATDEPVTGGKVIPKTRDTDESESGNDDPGT
jgi:hypothetical protein